MASEQHYQAPQTWYRVSPFSGISTIQVVRETPTRILYLVPEKLRRMCQAKEVWAHKESASHAFFSTLEKAREYELKLLHVDVDSAKLHLIECEEKLQRTLDGYNREDRIYFNEVR